MVEVYPLEEEEPWRLGAAYLGQRMMIEHGLHQGQAVRIKTEGHCSLLCRAWLHAVAQVTFIEVSTAVREEELEEEGCDLSKRGEALLDIVHCATERNCEKQHTVRSIVSKRRLELIIKSKMAAVKLGGVTQALAEVTESPQHSPLWSLGLRQDLPRHPGRGQHRPPLPRHRQLHPGQASVLISLSY